MPKETCVEKVCSCSGQNLKYYGHMAVRNYYKSKLEG